MNVCTRNTELVCRTKPDPLYPPEDGRTVSVWSYDYVAITAKPYPLKKKYRTV